MKWLDKKIDKFMEWGFRKTAEWIQANPELSAEIMRGAQRQTLNFQDEECCHGKHG